MECRDVPKAILFLHERSHRLSIDEIVFRDLATVVQNYQNYANDFDDWSDPKVAAFREFSDVVNYISYVCPDPVSYTHL